MNETSRSEPDLFCKDLCFPGWVMTYRPDSYFCRNVPLICVRFVYKSSKKINCGKSSLQKTTERLNRSVVLQWLGLVLIGKPKFSHPFFSTPKKIAPSALRFYRIIHGKCASYAGKLEASLPVAFQVKRWSDAVFKRN